MHKRKLMTVMACLALSASMLAACGGGSDKETTKEDTSTTGTTDNAGTKTDTAGTTTDEPAATDPFLNEKATISIYYPTPDQVENRKLEDDKIRRFTEKYPNITIEKSDWHYKVDEI